jgi:hypothetical protein
MLSGILQKDWHCYWAQNKQQAAHAYYHLGCFSYRVDLILGERNCLGVFPFGTDIRKKFLTLLFPDLD